MNYIVLNDDHDNVLVVLIDVFRRVDLESVKGASVVAMPAESNAARKLFDFCGCWGR